jgi:hypothetical protein
MLGFRFLHAISIADAARFVVTVTGEDLQITRITGLHGASECPGRLGNL